MFSIHLKLFEKIINPDILRSKLGSRTKIVFYKLWAGLFYFQLSTSCDESAFAKFHVVVSNLAEHFAKASQAFACQ